MLTISLDEQGDFEGLKNHGNHIEPLFIGGIIYDDQDNDQDLNNEKRRIYLYLKSICQSVDAVYPKDLHVNGKNHAEVRLVKQKISETLAEFLKSGRCVQIDNEFGSKLNKMMPRKGRYYIFSFVKYGQTIRETAKENMSILVRDDYASNLYVHMAEEIVERIIFHNPILNSVDNIRLNLATRRTVLEGEDVHKKAEEYISLGYKEDLDPNHKEEGKRTFLLTNADIYRTALEREMMDTGKKNIRVERIGVNSIYYGDESSNYRMEFLYLADLICTVLGFRVDTSSSQALLEDIWNRAKNYSGHADNLIFTYDAMDTLFKKAWNFLEQKEYYDALKLAYRGMHKESPYREFYSRVWFPRLVEKIQEEKDISAFSLALKKYYLSTRKNDVIQGELVFVYEVFEKMLEGMSFRNNDERAVLYELYDAGVSAYCHIGDNIKAKECFEKCNMYAKYVEIERYLRTRNKLVVSLTDSFQFEDAAKIAQENIIFHQELMNIRSLLFDEQEVFRNYGIALSQLGQISSSIHLNEAEKTFLEALQQMGDEDSSDYLQTESYLLHYYLEMGEKEKYDARAQKYFGGSSNLGKQLKYLIKEGGKGREGKFSMKFALYVYIKGLYHFHLKEINKNQLEKLYNIEETIKKIGGEKAIMQIGDHPWEIIYKYLALIAWENGNEEKFIEFREKIRSTLTYHEFTLDLICIFGETELAYKSGEDEMFSKLLGDTIEILKENAKEVYAKVTLIFDEKEQYQYLQENVINFMYH